MARPRQVAGGREQVIHVRFSVAEVADLDAARGPLTRSAYLRSLLGKTQSTEFSARTHTHPPGPLRPARITEVVAVDDSPVTELAPPAKHYHRRGAVVGRAWEQGAEVKMYACTEPGCPQVLR